MQKTATKNNNLRSHLLPPVAVVVVAPDVEGPSTALPSLLSLLLSPTLFELCAVALGCSVVLSELCEVTLVLVPVVAAAGVGRESVARTPQAEMDGARARSFNRYSTAFAWGRGWGW